jgi:hypothetical protein
MGANCVIFKRFPKVNTEPMGEHSPNLVTLEVGYPSHVSVSEK